jgi:hypothetical protein
LISSFILSPKTITRTRKNAAQRPNKVVDEDSNPEEVLLLPRNDDLVISNSEGEVELTVEPGDW